MRILDATCARREMWFNKHQPNTTFIDIRPEVEPDIVMDCCKTTFADKTFDLILFDPPHIGLTVNNKGKFAKKYGTFTSQQIRDTVAAAFKEFNRILKDEGFVTFKWNDHSQKLDKILALIEGFEVLYGQRTAFRTKYASSTYWVILKKKVSK